MQGCDDEDTMRQRKNMRKQKSKSKRVQAGTGGREPKNKLASFISEHQGSMHVATDLVRSTECTGSSEGLRRFLYKREGSPPQSWSRNLTETMTEHPFSYANTDEFCGTHKKD